MPPWRQRSRPVCRFSELAHAAVTDPVWVVALMTTVQQWIAVVGAVIAAGIWLGRLENRVAQLERTDTFIHGNTAAYVPRGN